jgi:hypothetical protein
MSVVPATLVLVDCLANNFELEAEALSKSDAMSGTARL